MTDWVVPRSRVADFVALTKPRVILLMLICALIGMLLATPSLSDLPAMIYGLIGIALVAGSAAIVNHVADAAIDSTMSRTAHRPIAAGRLRTGEALTFAAVLGATGLLLLFHLVNPLAAWLNFASWVGYAIVYTMFLKHATPQNIVYGGLFGAAPPLLGWVAVSNSITLDALLLVLIIFVWTPPHFWVLALERRREYAEAGVPMLPNTHGIQHTTTQIKWYTLVLAITSLLPVVLGTSGLIYLCTAAVLGGVFYAYSRQLEKKPTISVARRMFGFSISYLCLLFIGLLVDHFFRMAVA